MALDKWERKNRNRWLARLGKGPLSPIDFVQGDAELIGRWAVCGALHRVFAYRNNGVKTLVSKTMAAVAS
jgi:hypothetical protein